MKKDSSIIMFNQKQVRRTWDVERELWYFSVVDVIEILTDTQRPRKYWNDLKKKLSEEGSQLSEKIGQVRVCSKITQQKQFFGTKIVKLQPQNLFHLHYGDFFLAGEMATKCSQLVYKLEEKHELWYNVK